MIGGEIITKKLVHGRETKDIKKLVHGRETKDISDISILRLWKDNEGGEIW